ncbi:MAG: thioredoxin family protein [Proteobacteria bacterium]|nr:thioredoxin family protein [Pseudomonadota bacterium]
MTALTIEQDNRAQIRALLRDDAWVVACLCAAWCDACKTYRSRFEEWAGQHPDKHFLWIDIEDQADLVGDIDIENFPTLLLQRGGTVAFFGTVLPETQVAQRLLTSYVRKSETELREEAASSVERKTWQEECDLRRRLNAI